MAKIDQAVTFLRTRDQEASSRFYGDVLGLQLALDQGGCRIYRWAGSSAFIGFCSDGKPLPNPPSSVVLTIVTSTVDAWYQRLIEAGVPTDGPPRLNETYRIYHFYSVDPDGYTVEIQEFRDERWQP